MARPRKTGIDYFSFDVDFLSDIKVRKILRSCGEGSIGIIISVLTNIYRDKGYFILVDDDFYFFIADELGIKEDQVIKAIEKGTEVDLFSKELFGNYGILTSPGIQKRYMRATEKRKDVEIEKAYCLINKKDVSGHINLVNYVSKAEETELMGKETGVNVVRSTQRKEKESKVKESKVKESKAESNKETNNDVNAHRFYQQNFGVASAHIIQDLQMWIEDLSEEVVILALTKAIEKNAPYSYAKAIMKNWAVKDIKTVESAEAESLSNAKQKNTFNKPSNRKENLPDWATQQPTEKDELVDEDKQKEFEERLARIRAKRKGVTNE